MKKSTNERMAVIETEVKNLNKSLDTHTKNQKEDFSILFRKLDHLHGRFAGKWVEKVSVGILVSVIATIIFFVITK